jgi:cytochrome oxidase Cu insertion factor (SCO1/SenC/PrrC family)
VSESGRARSAVAALAAILVITTGWWALALWPTDATTAEWILRTRTACFGTTETGLPDAGGWILLAGQPLGMLGFLAIVWRRELGAGLALVTSRTAGQLATGMAAALIVAGLSGAVVRVRTAGYEPFSTGAGDIAAELTRVNDWAPALGLVDQAGREIVLESFRGRRVLVGFAFAHCATVCPLLVSDMLDAQRAIEDDPPALVVVTLDPWRDTPSRLPAMAEQWGLRRDAHVLSGVPETVERVLNAWRVPRVRNERTGDLVHPAIVYVVGRDGRIAYAVSGSAEAMAAALRQL